MNDKTLRLGLIGKDVSKSDSPRIHTFILGQLGYQCQYERFSVDSTGFDGAIRCLLGDFDGFNVTIPYKRDILEYLDELQGDAAAFGAVNTVVSRTRTGYNTDGVGFLMMARLAGVEMQQKKVLVLGGGGAGRSSAVALKNAGATVYMYQRNREKLQETCAQLGIWEGAPYQGGYDILVNATGVGMHDTVGVSPVESTAFSGATWAIDLIYEPAQSEFLCLAEKKGVKTLNGKAMLFYQAYFADCLYLGLEPNDSQAELLYQQYQAKEKEV